MKIVFAFVLSIALFTSGDFRNLSIRKTVTGTAMALGIASFHGSPFIFQSSIAQADASVSFSGDDLMRLKRGRQELRYLLDHWLEKTTYCNFGEVTTDMMQVENKNKLIEEAATGSLWEKSPNTVNIKCKRDPQVVRAFVGLSPDVNPTLRYAEKLMKSKSALERIAANGGDVDEYFQDVEAFVEGLAEVDLTSYAARTDYSSTETRTEAETKKDSEAMEEGTVKRDYLAQCKDSVKRISKALDGVVEILDI